MKIKLLALAVLTTATGVAAQQSATVQMQCHELSANSNFVGSDEVLINGMVCKAVRQIAAPGSAPGVIAVNSAVANPAPTTNVPIAPPVADAPAPLLPATPESMKIKLGAKVYITPMDGFENYLAAALVKKHVELVPVLDPTQADYVISGTSVDKKAGWAKIAFMGNIHSDNAASITMTDKRTGATVYAYAVDKKSTLHGQQTTAEACAKHLKSHMEGHD